MIFLLCDIFSIITFATFHVRHSNFRHVTFATFVSLYIFTANQATQNFKKHKVVIILILSCLICNKYVYNDTNVAKVAVSIFVAKIIVPYFKRHAIFKKSGKDGGKLVNFRLKIGKEVLQMKYCKVILFINPILTDYRFKIVKYTLLMKMN
jgi:hypothetical protein